MLTGVLWVSGKILLWIHLILDFLQSNGFSLLFQSVHCYGSLKLLISSWIDFIGFAESRNLSISFKFSSIMEYMFLKYSIHQYIFIIQFNICTFSFDSDNLGTFFFPLISCAKRLLFYFMCKKYKNKEERKKSS